MDDKRPTDGPRSLKDWAAALIERTRDKLARRHKGQQRGRIRPPELLTSRQQKRLGGAVRMSGRPGPRPSPSKMRGVPMAERWAQQDLIDAARARARKASR